MKHSILSALLVIVSYLGQAAVIQGKITTVAPGKTLVLTLINYDTRIDTPVKSFTIKPDSTFTIELTLPEPLIYSLGEAGKPLLHLLVKDQDKISLNITAERITGRGSAGTEYLIAYENHRKRLFTKWLQPVYDSSAVAEKSGDKVKLEYWNKEQTKASDNYKEELSKWVMQPFFIRSLAAIHHSLRWHPDNDISLMDTMLANYEKLYKGYELTKELANKVTRTKRTALGANAPTFQSKFADGKSYDFSKTKAEYILLDFWASWCKPCRQESPTLVRLYNAYKDKGFTIVSVSVDDNKEKWLNAVTKDNLSWTNVSELKGWASPTATLYNVSAKQNSFLIDSQGNIIAKNLRGHDLENKLAELLGK